jgi:hypothetical protein
MPGPSEQERMEIRVEGIFDVPAAQSVVRACERAEGPRRVLIDMTRVREFHDFALAVLAHGIARRRERVTLQGLGDHQRRMLAYLGLGDADGDRAGGAP